MDPLKRPKTEPTRQCQYGAGCYRKNPQHFVDYAHKHLSDIRNNASAPSGCIAPSDYTIPDDLFMSREIVLEQLQILDQLFGQQSSSQTMPDAKRARTETSSVKPARVDNKKPAITSAQLMAGLAQASTSTGGASSSSSGSKAPLSTQAEQLAAYRARHKTQQQQQPSNSATSRNPAPTTASPLPTPSTSSTSHPAPKNINDYISVVNPRGQMAAKLAAAAPYNFFLTTITASEPTHTEPLSITFQEILDPSLGTIESTVQFNFMVDIGWLLGHYYFAGCLDKPLLVLYGDETPELQTIATKKPQVTAIRVQMASPFGTHHTKMMLLGYADGSMRCVVSTANLVEDDWHNRTQGLWISPRCPRVAADADTGAGNGPTGFRDDLVRYLVTYNEARLQPWIARVRCSDFSAVNVFFVASVPGGHRADINRGHDWGHPKLGRLLAAHSAPIDDACPLVTQSSSIGSLGPSVQAWIHTDIVASFRRDTAPPGLRRLPAFKHIFPSYANVRASHDGLLGGGGLPYGRATDAKQPWLKQHLCQWKSTSRHRSRAMPHIKTYCRWSDRGLYWFCLTSANLSKAAWGAFNKGTKLDTPLRIMSYEAGVLFVPKFVLAADVRFFPLSKANGAATAPPFPMPYDVALQPYGASDTPFLMDYLLEQMGRQ